MAENVGSWDLSSSEFDVTYAEVGSACTICGGTGGVKPMRIVVDVKRGAREASRYCIGCLIRRRNEWVQQPQQKQQPQQPQQKKKSDCRISSLEQELRDANALSTELSSSVREWRVRYAEATKVEVVKTRVNGGIVRFGVPAATARSVQQALGDVILSSEEEERAKDGLRCAKVVYEAMGGNDFDETSASRWGDADLITVPMDKASLKRLGLSEGLETSILSAHINGVPLVLESEEAVEAHVKESIRRAGGDCLSQLYLDPEKAEALLHRVLYSKR